MTFWHHTLWIYMWKDMNKHITMFISCSWDYKPVLPSICWWTFLFSLMSMYPLSKMKWNFSQDSQPWKCWGKGSHDCSFSQRARAEETPGSQCIYSPHLSGGPHTCESWDHAKLLYLLGQAGVEALRTHRLDGRGRRRAHSPSSRTDVHSHSPCLLCTGARRPLMTGKTRLKALKSYNQKIRF